MMSNPEAQWRLWRLLELPNLGQRGYGFLVEASSATGIPFPIERAYWIHHWDRAHTRGGHAHRHIQQVFICLDGAVRLHLNHPHGDASSTLLDRPYVALWTAPLVWLQRMEPASREATLLVLASGRHDEAEYIRNYDEYLALFSPRHDPERSPALVGAR